MKPRILLTNNHLERMGGSETWVLTMARALLKRGFDVGVFTHHKGFVSELLKDHIDDHPEGYDLALINHNTCIGVKAKYKIYTSHGIWDGLETPPEGADYYVAVTENISEMHGIETIIKNPIDTELFKPTSPIRERPERILSITDGAPPLAVTFPSRYEDNMSDLINEHDLVISIGRGALESMSCGRNVITWDKRPWMRFQRGDGYINDFSMLRGNVAGEYKEQVLNWGEEIAKYDPKQGERNREYILKNHDVNKIIDQYLWIYTKNAT